MLRSVTALFFVLPSLALAQSDASKVERPTVTDPKALVGKALFVQADDAIALNPVTLEVAVVIDHDFAPIDERLVNSAIRVARQTFSERFNATPPKFVVKERLSAEAFLARYIDPYDARCMEMLGVRYKGGGLKEAATYKQRATRFLERWPLDSLRSFLDPEERGVADHAAVFDIAARRYVETVARLETEKATNGRPLVEPSRLIVRSFASWSCALGSQRDFDVVITNGFILADVMTEPHPHAVFGKAKIGGIAGPNAHRPALGYQTLLASTFGIDTNIPFLSELDGRPASPGDRAALLGGFLLAHEVAHSVFGIPDFFDHPPECLMTSRAGESYRTGLEKLRAHRGPCPKCNRWVEAKGLLDAARRQLDEGKPKRALKTLSRASRRTPKQIHGGYKRRMATLSLLVSEAYRAQGKARRAKKFAERAVALDPRSAAARATLALFTRTSSTP